MDQPVWKLATYGALTFNEACLYIKLKLSWCCMV